MFIQCFGDDRVYIHNLYGELDGENECTGAIKNHRICVIENEIGEILSMVQTRPVKAVYLSEGAALSAWTDTDNSHIETKQTKEKADISPSNETSRDVSYILCVATRPDYRRRGLMDSLMNTVCNRLLQKKEPWCFLVPVDTEVYRHLGFTHDWYFNKGEEQLLDADEGLLLCSAKLLSAPVFHAPDLLRPA